ncbi:hypothetical protein SPACI_045180 [Sporomusa acidovorans DSM 3132]|uniref:Uncharacterized protein n=1 Tax=Sporomusa acidovorans (strain ATCC 49682 / DSM 3132 / Mol) TaxID=1123286 RepID=A0ABZ3J7U8_SPOA4|nr:hypothetical protein SPACI_41510 [Sporomusa acidovorans DSM 3132]SDE06460.1 hypothetical protein SAMN04488499_100771 [Sporomusa acidovorans]
MAQDSPKLPQENLHTIKRTFLSKNSHKNFPGENFLYERIPVNFVIILRKKNYFVT